MQLPAAKFPPSIGLVICVCAALVAWLLASPVNESRGMTWDEAYYYPTFVAASKWTGMLLTDPGLAMGSEGIRFGWEEIHELPPLVKWLGAASVSIGGTGWGRLHRMRLVPALAFGATLFIMFLIGRRYLPNGILWIPLLLYALHPRVLGHAGIAATESVFAAVTMLTLWAALNDLRKWRWRLLLAVCLGLALATKVNGIILLAVVLFWLATRHWFDGRASRNLRGTLLKADWITLGIVLPVAPLVAFLMWPWMWDDTAARIGEYYRFIAEHSHQGVWFLGSKWNFGEPPAPLYYPLAMIHVTTPVVTMVLFWAAMAAGLTRFASRRKLDSMSQLLALLTVAPVIASSLPNAPKYDGIRLFFPALAPAALLIGRGVFFLRGWLRRTRPKVLTSGLQRGFIAGTILLVISYPGVDWYNFPTRFMRRGNARFSFEQTYWGNAVDAEAIGWLNSNLPPNARVKTLALQPAVFEILKEWEVLRPDIEFEGAPPYDAHLMQNRKGFWGRTEWHFHDDRIPLRTFGRNVGDEPLVFIYDGAPPIARR